MTMEDRIEIQECLCKEMTFKAIARRIGKDPTTVSKEVKLHAHDYRNSFSKSDETCPKLLKALYLATHEIAKKMDYAAEELGHSSWRAGDHWSP